MPVSAVRDFPPSDRSPSRLIGGELLALAASLLLYPFGICASRKRTARRAEQRTVVLVHGYLGNRSSFYPLAVYLKAQGLGSLLPFSYSAANGIERAALELREFLRERVRGGRIELVCHSLGGLIARAWLQLLRGPRPVGRPPRAPLPPPRNAQAGHLRRMLAALGDRPGAAPRLPAARAPAGDAQRRRA